MRQQHRENSQNLYVEKNGGKSGNKKKEEGKIKKKKTKLS